MHRIARVVLAVLTMAAMIAYILGNTWLAGGLAIGLIGATALISLESLALQRKSIHLTRNLPRRIEKQLPGMIGKSRRRGIHAVPTETLDPDSVSTKVDAVVDVVKTLQAQYIGRLDRMQDSIDQYVNSTKTKN